MKFSQFGRVLSAVGFLAVGSGCGNTLNSHVPSEYQEKRTEIGSIALAGRGASMAAPAFDKFGYNLVDLGTSKDDPVERAKNLGIPYVAIVAPVDSEDSAWDGFFAFSMRVTETINRKIVWSAQGNFGQRGIFINQAKTTTKAMHEMVRDFSRTFPPKK